MNTFRHTILNDRNPGGLYRAVREDPLPISEIIQSVKDKRPDSGILFQRIFFCYRLPSSTDLLCLDILSKAICEGSITLRIEFISIPPTLDNCLKNVGGDRGRTVESAEHQGMKIWLIDFLRSKGIKAASEFCNTILKRSSGFILVMLL